MATITEDYVSFGAAKLLKEKGFNEETEYVFSNNGELLRLSHFGIKDLTNADCNNYHTWQFPIEGVASIISAPTLQMAMKWLREVYGLHVWVEYSRLDFNKEYPYLWNIAETKIDGDYWGGSYHKHPEKAVEEAIRYCIENLI